jgi:hypothetical protein
MKSASALGVLGRRGHDGLLGLGEVQNDVGDGPPEPSGATSAPHGYPTVREPGDTDQWPQRDHRTRTDHEPRTVRTTPDIESSTGRRTVSPGDSPAATLLFGPHRTGFT